MIAPEGERASTAARASEEWGMAASPLKKSEGLERSTASTGVTFDI